MSPNTIHDLTIILVVLSLVATYLNVHKKKVCFKIWLGTNLAWVCYDWWIGAVWQAVLFACYVVLAVWGIWRWKDGK